MAFLVIVHWSQVDAIQESWCILIYVIWLVLSLHIFTNLVLAVTCIVQILLVHHHARTEILGDSIFIRKEVQLFS
jgi:hypothetical protein